MFGFYLFSGLLISFALALLLYPLIKAMRRDAFALQATKTREELMTLTGLSEKGVIDADALSKSRRELSDKLLSALEAPVARDRTAQLMAVLFLGLLPLSVMLLYQHVGNPRGMSFAPAPLAGSAANSAQAASGEGAAAPAQGMDLNKAAEGLKERLSKSPDDGEGWQLLGRTYLELQDFANAADALKKAIALLPKNADLYVQFGEAVGIAARPNLPPPEAEASIDQALAMDAKHQNGLWLKGVYRKLANDPKAALTAWNALLEQLPPGNQMTAQLEQQIQSLRAELGETASAPSPAVAAETAAPQSTTASADSSDASAAAGSASVKIAVTISPELKAKLGPNDVLFVFAKAANGPPMPLAVHRSPAVDLSSDTPLQIVLSDSDAMMPSMKLSMFPKISVGARVSKSGVANAQSGDFQALSEVMAQPISGEITLTIAQVLP
jgi:cytochrome c-type biogenesis protein CcmH